MHAPPGDVFSKRGAPAPDVFTHDLSQKLRTQLLYVFEEDIGDLLEPQHWRQISSALAREHGRQPQERASAYDPNYRRICTEFLQNAPAPQVLDLIEVSLSSYVRAARHDMRVHRHHSLDSIIAEINQRFRENGCGYQVQKPDRVIRIDSQLVHVATIVPALNLLSAAAFAGPNREFLSAQSHLRNGRMEEAITDACKAFESTMKVICEARGWPVDDKASANILIKTLVTRGLVPVYDENGLIHLASIRNRIAAHGAGSTPRNVQEHQAAHALHLAASNIVYLVEMHKAVP